MPGSIDLHLPGLDIFFQSERAKIGGQIASHLAQFIRQAQTSVDCAIYDLKHPDVLAALKAVAERVKLRIAYDGGKTKNILISRTADPKFAGSAQAIAAAGLARYATPIHVAGGHLMHDKFIVKDGTSIWTGSGNFTHGGLELQDNNFLVVDSREVATVYGRVFEELLLPGHDKSHSRKGAAVGGVGSQKPLHVGKVMLAPYFSTGVGENEGVDGASTHALAGAKKVRLIAMLVSDPDILQALNRFRTPQADIKGVLDPHEMKMVIAPPKGKPKANPAWFWFAKGDKRFVAAPSHGVSSQNAGLDNHDLMHNKVMIIDDRIVLTGSYNFSENAEKNDENMLWIESTDVAAAYERYFDALFQQYAMHGAPLPPR